MKYIPDSTKRRTFLKTLAGLPVVAYTLGCGAKKENKNHDVEVVPNQGPTKTALEMTNDLNLKPGYLSILQGPTSDKESLINIVVPRLKKYTYEVRDEANNLQTVELYETVVGPGFHNIDKLKVSGLSLGVTYTLKVIDKKTIVDQRQFSALNIHNTQPRFAMLSCMSDDYRFSDAIEPMWDRLQQQNPEFLILTGDVVYVDSFEYVERKKATEFDLWQRYVDSLKRIPLYHWTKLVPAFTTWDDHDYGTNDGDRDFVSKELALKLFRAVYGGHNLPGVWTQGPNGVSSMLSAFGQNFYLMDDRTFRQPNKNQIEKEEFAHWGQGQHEWLLQNLATHNKASWIINGNQCFSGIDLSFKESFEVNSSQEFINFVNELKAIQAPVVFGSGDVHLSEVMRIPQERLGYETFEFTSSAMHSYVGGGWENPLRVSGAYCKEFNFMMIQSQSLNRGLNINVTCLGLAKDPYFSGHFKVQI